MAKTIITPHGYKVEDNNLGSLIPEGGRAYTGIYLTMSDTKTALSESTNTLSELATSSNINWWSAFKPNGRGSRDGMLADGGNMPYDWVYRAPSGSYDGYIMGQFIGYNTTPTAGGFLNVLPVSPLFYASGAYWWENLNQEYTISFTVRLPEWDVRKSGITHLWLDKQVGSTIWSESLALTDYATGIRDINTSIKFTPIDTAEWLESDNVPFSVELYLSSSAGKQDTPYSECATEEHPRWDENATHWGVDAFNFRALPGGDRYSNGLFYPPISKFGYWWSSTEFSSSHAWYRFIDFASSDVYRLNTDKSIGFSVRAVRDATVPEQALADGTIISSAYTGNDGQTYNGVKIGLQVWTTENLKEVKYAVVPDVNNLDVPEGWLVPTEAEWEAERLTWATNDRAGAFGSNLKLSAGGGRLSDGDLEYVGTFGLYWSSSVLGGRARRMGFSFSTAGMLSRDRSMGRSVRLIKETGSSLVTGDQTFRYMGDDWTYQEVTSATGRIWMDRNLGASQVATAFNDALSYGDLFQWGRNIDGHQIRTSLTTAVLSATDDPGHGDFITTSAALNDWRDPQNDDLWQYISDIIPTGLDNATWEADTVGAMAVYPHGDIAGLNSEAEVVEAYGRLYNWYAVDNAKGLINPEGKIIYGYLYNHYATQEDIGSSAEWVVPSATQWEDLRNYLLTYAAVDADNIGNHLKSTRVAPDPHPRWEFNSIHIPLDTWGFGALPGGIRYDFGDGFTEIETHCYFAQSTINLSLYARRVEMRATTGNLTVSVGSYNRQHGQSIRLFRPATASEITNNSDGDACDLYSGNDGKKYQTVYINEKVWLAENLAETLYRDNSPIAKVTEQVEWEALTTPAYCAYDNDEDYAYKIIWSVPTDADFTTLTDYIISLGDYTSSTVGNALKSCRQVNSSIDDDGPQYQANYPSPAGGTVKIEGIIKQGGESIRYDPVVIRRPTDPDPDWYQPKFRYPYGYLYNFYVIQAFDGVWSSEKITSSDEWRVPSWQDYVDLANFCNGSHYITATQPFPFNQYYGNWDGDNNIAQALKSTSSPPHPYWLGLGERDDAFDFKAEAGGRLHFHVTSGYCEWQFLSHQSTMWSTERVWPNDPHYTKLQGVCLHMRNFQDNKDIRKHFSYYRSGHSIRLVRNKTQEDPSYGSMVDPLPYIGNDGKSYPTITLGNQVWITRNLEEEYFRGGTMIPFPDGYSGVTLTDVQQIWGANTGKPMRALCRVQETGTAPIITE